MITLFKGSILDVKADAIVNPANSFMRHSGGLALVIDFNAFGKDGSVATTEDWPSIQAWFDVAKASADHQSEWEKYWAVIKEYSEFRPGLIPTGGAVLGPPGALSRRFKAIIHAVGPIWGGGEYFEQGLLYGAYARARNLATDAGYSHVAYPAISAGVFGMPIDEVAHEAIAGAARGSIDATFALMGHSHLEAFQRAADNLCVEVIVKS